MPYQHAKNDPKVIHFLSDEFSIKFDQRRNKPKLSFSASVPAVPKTTTVRTSDKSICSIE